MCEARSTEAGLRILVLSVFVFFGVGSTGTIPVVAQQKIGYVDTEYILNKMPEYTTVQEKLDELEQQWKDEIQEKRKEVETLKQEYEARELLYTDQERKRKQKAIEAAQQEVQKLRQQYFGPEGKLYSRQQELMRPVQERVFEATEAVATDAGYDYIVDKKGDTLFLYAKEEHNVSDLVLRELGINVDRESSGQ